MSHGILVRQRPAAVSVLRITSCSDNTQLPCLPFKPISKTDETKIVTTESVSRWTVTDTGEGEGAQKETERETDRQTDRDRDRQRQRDRERDRQTDREGQRQTDKDRERLRERGRERERERERE